jgi:hypothetical protein
MSPFASRGRRWLRVGLRHLLAGFLKPPLIAPGMIFAASPPRANMDSLETTIAIAAAATVKNNFRDFLHDETLPGPIARFPT